MAAGPRMRAGMFLRILRNEPGRFPRALLRRFVRRFDLAEHEFLLNPGDIADSLRVRRGLPAAGRDLSGRPRIAWVTFAPGPGAGGPTTLFRMVQYAESNGFDCTVLFYGRTQVDLDRYREVVRKGWPWLTARLDVVGAVIDGYDVVVASSWPTAHVVALRTPQRVPVLYFIQDFEPYFYPKGGTYALAEDSYRFGYRNIALGHMVKDALWNEARIDAEYVPFGADTTHYFLEESSPPRRGIVLYARLDNDRRGFRLALLALARFHRDHPDEPIHVYGDQIPDAEFPFISHGSLSPEALRGLYNTVVAGIALSFTNISLVAEEMLASGVIPIVNDSPLPRADMTNPYVAWAPATPSGIAEALGAAVLHPDRENHARAVAASAAGRSWDPTGAAVVDIIRDELCSPKGGFNPDPSRNDTDPA